jgi:hypothetical protein
MEILDNEQSTLFQSKEIANEGSDYVPRPMRAVINDKVEAFTVAGYKPLRPVGIGIADHNVDSRIIVAQLAARRIDIAAYDRGSGVEMLRPDRKGSPVLNTDL